ncbi:MAG: hypothetical protein LBL83_05605 [Clostridiales bacterium]|nr:hypothetical protein [Clostridiales bacterium]
MGHALGAALPVCRNQAWGGNEKISGGDCGDGKRCGNDGFSFFPQYLKAAGLSLNDCPAADDGFFSQSKHQISPKSIIEMLY